VHCDFHNALRGRIGAGRVKTYPCTALSSWQRHLGSVILAASSWQRHLGSVILGGRWSGKALPGKDPTRGEPTVLHAAA